MSGRVRKPTDGDGEDYEREQLLDSPSRDTNSDDDFVLRNEQAGTSSNSRLADVRQQVEEVTAVMKENVNRLFTRGDRLDELNERSESLQTASASFHSASTRLRRKAWWDSVRLRVILGSVGIIIILILIIWLTVKYT